MAAGEAVRACALLFNSVIKPATPPRASTDENCERKVARWLIVPMHDGAVRGGLLSGNHELLA